ncbi:MAG TPA: glycine--tRNA ligase subunit beta, partial [Geminicoccaceae bacterium]|nr:glycine--tRNA ligase subunit beta [Geminicoccaceae bacterium]
DLRELVTAGLRDARLAYEDAAAYATPQRLCLVVRGLAERQPDIEVERRGPRVGAPEKALEGFLGSLGAESYVLEEQDDRKGRVHVARFRRGGLPAAEVVGPLIADVMGRFPWPRSMRWGHERVRWVRPLHGILCLLGGEVVPVRFGPVESDAVTRGHRFMAPEPFEVTDFGDYRARLRAASVMLDPAERRRVIAGGAARLAEAEGLRLRPDEELIGELAGLVEWPVPLAGGIDEHFMALPSEVLVTSMRQHQRYLALEDAAGVLAPRFVVVANIRPKDGGRAIVAGNERVLRARLWDAEFFWNQDRRATLESRLAALDGVVFHARLGSLGEKAERLRGLAGWLAEYVPGAQPEQAARAAVLCKADLTTGMVGEFPELQGVMGRYYALGDGEPKAVAEAIAEHYSPKGPNDACPTAPVSVATALADKLDTLVGFFAIGEKPTGSKDPYALRRAALGVIRLVLENNLRLPLLTASERGLAAYGDTLIGADISVVANDILDFFADRLKVHLRGAGVRHDLIGAVFAAGRDDDLVRLLARVRGLEEFLATEDGANLLTA